jgi:hypothetical protein
MSLLPRKGLLAIAAVVDVALQTDGRPISAKTLTTRHGLPRRHLESVLQSLVRDGILKGIRGPQGGYELARERRAEEEPNNPNRFNVAVSRAQCLAIVVHGAELLEGAWTKTAESLIS